MTKTLTKDTILIPATIRKNPLPAQRGGDMSDEDYNKYISPMTRFAPGLNEIIPNKYFEREEK